MIHPKSVFKFELLKVEGNQQIAATWTVPADLPYLAGHFPNQPMVPAVAIIDAALEVVNAGLESRASLEKVKNAKFTSPLLPGQTVKIDAMKVGENEWSIDFKTEEQVARILVALK